jgi:hypothetical protein
VQEDEYFFYYLAKEFIFWQTFIFSLWSFFICCHKVSKFLQALIGGWLKTSFKQKCEHVLQNPKAKDLLLPLTQTL